MFKAAGQFLCLHCYRTLQRVYTEQQQAANENLRNLMTIYNYLSAQIDTTMGMPGLSPRMQIPPPAIRPTIQEGPMTFNNFTISESKIGVINTGEIHRIDMAMARIGKQGPTGLAAALKDFTEAIIDREELGPSQKNELLEQVAEISEQLARPPEKRQKGILRALLGGVQKTITTVAALSETWSKLEPFLKGLL